MNFDTPRELAGSHYVQMVQSHEITRQCLSASDSKVRLAAVLICQNDLEHAQSPEVIAACLDIAKSDAEESVRSSAIEALGRALSGTKSSEASRFLARVALKTDISPDIRISAYWALREIQFGKDDPDVFKAIIYLTKMMVKRFPDRFSEADVKSNVLFGGRNPETEQDLAKLADWDCAEQVDWHIDLPFVERYSDSAAGRLWRALLRLVPFGTANRV